MSSARCRRRAIMALWRALFSARRFLLAARSAISRSASGIVDCARSLGGTSCL
ncbi:hypothetical protein PF007_g21560 [Phytophthora fragariae]|uniref:RxLR effector protein n=1 Tax=Phytophthora fragariae TaxID=53985 RepID=A0A6A3QZA8_9STRA|nr:hypothetical protein PF007_g21560 [Phytophthora fragariae]KAE9289604.1 hypothetical protein PF001_g19965 [Phytophthora fragariae]